MSAPTAPTPADRDALDALLGERVDAAVFFDKLAAEGVVPRTEAEAVELWEMGKLCAQARQAHAAKQAAASPIAELRAKLAHDYAAAGLVAPAADPHRQLARALAARPEISQAVLGLARAA